MLLGVILLLIESSVKTLLFASIFLAQTFAFLRPQLTEGGYREDDPSYRVKRRLVCYAWCLALFSIVMIPTPAFAVPAFFFTTFVSFMILDEMG